MQIEPFGDSALLVTFGIEIDSALNARVHALAAAIHAVRSAPASPWGVPVPAYSSLLAPYDAERSTYPQALKQMRELVASLPGTDGEESAVREVVTIRVRYGGEYGPDLADVAAMHGLTLERVVEMHSGTLYRVFMLGFAPGFAYLGPLPTDLITPRRSTPRPRVPPGSVAIAGAQTGIYPLATPGGWHLLGQTDARLWNPQRDPPALLRPGCFVRFVPL
ncbi:MAG: 5-oxoprolinase subunit PxpB [Chloroflexia bacterium]